jgi:hypothetical protein
VTPAILFKFALAALLLIWPAAIESKFNPGPKVDKPDAPLTQETPDAHVMAYCYSGPNAPAERRVCRIAREVSTVVDEHAALGRIPFTGPAAQQATSLALLEIAWHESGFRSKVEDCRITGDLPTRHSKINEGLAVSMFQLQANNREDLFEFAQTKPPRPRRYSREAVCSSNVLAAKLALHALMRHAVKSRGTTIPASVSGMFFTYASGKSGKTKAGQEHVEQFEAMTRKHGLVLVPKNGAMWVEVKQ